MLVAIFGAACISFCFGVCAVTSTLFGGLYPVTAVVFGVLLLLTGFLMHREVKKLALHS